MATDEFITEVGGVKFRPISCASLAWLRETKCPLLCGGEFTAAHYAILLWLHGAPLGEVVDNMLAGTYERAAIYWAAEQPPEVFAMLTDRRLLGLAKLFHQIYVDKKTGFFPFPGALLPVRPRGLRGWIGTIARRRRTSNT